jgi:SAM-dependent methyltransferase
VLEPGPGMGFFTLELARLVGISGRVIAVDVQLKMIDRLKRRAAKADLLDRVTTRLASSESMGIKDLQGSVDFILAFSVVHELPDASRFFGEAAVALRPGATLLLAEPNGHVKAAEFDFELKAAAGAGFNIHGRPCIQRTRAALLKKAGLPTEAAERR